MSRLRHVTTLPATYPGFPSGADDHRAGIRPFSPEDDGRLWVLDFHAPNGLTPLGMTSVELTAAGSRAAADAIPMPGARGLSARVAGSHPYLAPLGVADHEAAARAEIGAARLPAITAGARREWSLRAAELDREFQRLVAAARAARGLSDARRLLDRSLHALAHAWRVHFDFMYPLLAGYFEFRAYADALGIRSDSVTRLLQGYETTITATDGAIWDLAQRAETLDVGDELRRHHGRELSRWLETEAPSELRSHVTEFLQRFGWRTEGIYEVALVPWAEDPTPLLERVKSLLDEIGTRTYADVLAASTAARRQAEQQAFARLTGSEADGFRDALATARAANFAWWNEDHNPYVDLRAHIPLRHAAVAVARAVGMPDVENVFFLFRNELQDLADGRLSLPAALARIPERIEFHAAWAVERAGLPVLAGAAPRQVDDPVLREIFGVTGELIGADGDAVQTADLTGIAASAGVARGMARVLRSSQELDRLLPGEILVCEATTPSWTPAFAAAAACVCDQGGQLTHAAIVCREYGIPCVTGTGRATRVIETGDLLEVDGGTGRVRVLRRAAQPAALRA